MGILELLFISAVALFQIPFITTTKYSNDVKGEINFKKPICGFDLPEPFTPEPFVSEIVKVCPPQLFVGDSDEWNEVLLLSEPVIKEISPFKKKMNNFMMKAKDGMRDTCDKLRQKLSGNKPALVKLH